MQNPEEIIIYPEPVQNQEEYQKKLAMYLVQNGLTQVPKGTSVTVNFHNSFNTTETNSRNRNLRYHQQELNRLSQREPKVSQMVGPIIFTFWLICMAVLMGIALGEK